MLRMILIQTPHIVTRRLACACNKLMRNNKAGHLQSSAQSISSSTASAWQASPPGCPRIIIITGPTAVGKTKLGLELAKRLDGEIISADSVQVYKGLDIGSDKMPVKQREGIPHHLVDILPPDAEFSAGDFNLLGRKAAEDIISRGKTPIVVGGTGFYLRWFIFGKAQTPPSNPQTAAQAQQLIEQAWTRAAAAAVAAAVGGQQHAQQQPMPEAVGAIDLNQVQQLDAAVEPAAQAQAQAAAAVLTEDQRWDVAVDVVAELGDPQAAARVGAERNNWYRLQRVLQILLQNGGKPLSDLDVDTTKPLEYDFRCFFLHRNRIELYDRICLRVEEMVSLGLLQEALMLLDLGFTPNSHVATKAIGYRQACQFLQTAFQEGQATKQQLHQMILDIATASRNLVKSQTTWFRDDDLFRWIEVGGRDVTEVLAELHNELEKPQHEGRCGDSGRLDRDLQKALKRYVPTLRIYNDEQKVAEVLGWVNEVVATRKQQQQQQQQQQ